MDTKQTRIEKALRKLGVSKDIIGRVEQARDYLAVMSSRGTPFLPDFTLHNQHHSDNIILLLSRLKGTFRFALNEREAYLLAMSAYLHDLGMFFSQERFRSRILPHPARALHVCPKNRCDRLENYQLSDKPIGEQIREVHNLLTVYMLLENSGYRSGARRDDLPYIIAICRGHRKANLRETGCTCYRTEPATGGDIQVGLLASLLRLADALDFHRNRTPKQIFEQGALDFLKNPVALEHWLKHYFVIAPHIARYDDSGNITLLCTVNFRVPMKRINEKKYLNFFRPLFEKHLTELREKDLDINQYPPIFTEALRVTAVQAVLEENEQLGFRDLPQDIIHRINASGCKDSLTFLAWLQQNTVPPARDDLTVLPEPDQVSWPQIQGDASADRSRTMSRNPFHLSKMEQIAWFYNRRSEVDTALEMLRARSNVEVMGPRKIGKTWFLRYISHPDVLRQHGLHPRRNVCVYIDCQHRCIQQEEAQVYQRMRERLTDAARQVGVDLEPTPGDESAAAMAFEQTLKEMHRLKLRVILLLDEFEEMAQNPNLDEIFFNHLRSSVNADDVDVAYVTASHTPLVHLQSERDRLLSSPFFNIFQPIRLGLFSEQDSRHLVEDSLHRAGARFPEELIEWVLKIGGGHPFFLQMAGHHAFRLTSTSEALTEHEQGAFLQQVNEDATRHFEFYWKKLDHRDQYALSNLLSSGSDHDYQENIEHLGNACLITQRDGKYHYFSTLFETFVRRQTVKAGGKSLTGRVLGSARIVAKIGSGGMATVYKAYQKSLDRHVAVKILPHDVQGEVFLQRFEREAKAVARLEHPNILPIYEYGRAEDLTFIIMQYVSGGTLADRIRESLPLSGGGVNGTPVDVAPGQEDLVRLRQILVSRFDESELRTLCFDLGVNYDALPGAGTTDKARELVAYLERRTQIPELLRVGEKLRPDILWHETPGWLRETIKIIIQVGQALHYAHEQGIVHRDVKPANILMAPGDRPLLADFGLAQILTDPTRNSEKSGVTGTANYMAPEQAQDGDANPCSDIYALGIVLYEQVTGRLPFKAENEIETMLKKISELPPSPRQFNPSLPLKLEQVILKAIAPQPEERYPSALEMVKALRSAISQT